MPRKRKSQGVQVPTGLNYGQGEQLAQAQREMPLPGPGTRPQPVAGPGAVAPSAPGPATPADPMAAALAAAARMAPPSGGLGAPSARPGEPVTAGLSIGRGAGPEALPVPVVPEEDRVLLDLVNAYRIAPSPALGRLIEVVRARSSARQRTLDAGRRSIPRR